VRTLLCHVKQGYKGIKGKEQNQGKNAHQHNFRNHLRRNEVGLSV